MLKAAASVACRVKMAELYLPNDKLYALISFTSAGSSGAFGLIMSEMSTEVSRGFKPTPYWMAFMRSVVASRHAPDLPVLSSFGAMKR